MQNACLLDSCVAAGLGLWCLCVIVSVCMCVCVLVSVQVQCGAASTPNTILCTERMCDFQHSIQFFREVINLVKFYIVVAVVVFGFCCLFSQIVFCSLALHAVWKFWHCVFCSIFFPCSQSLSLSLSLSFFTRSFYICSAVHVTIIQYGANEIVAF